MTALDDIATERQRQINEEGWTEEHDNEHSDRELARAAAAYAAHDFPTTDVDWLWPWPDGFKPKSRRENLIRAGALIVAEIERIDRGKGN